MTRIVTSRGTLNADSIAPVFESVLQSKAGTPQAHDRQRLLQAFGEARGRDHRRAAMPD